MAKVLSPPEQSQSSAPEREKFILQHKLREREREIADQMEAFDIESVRRKLKLDISLAAVVYSVLLGSCLGNSIHARVLHRKGPVYIAMFKPLSIAIAAAMGVMFLGDTLHLGSVIGATVILLGFYAVMWGKATEEMSTDYETADLESSSDHQKTPLLRSIKEERGLQNGNC